MPPVGVRRAAAPFLGAAGAGAALALSYPPCSAVGGWVAIPALAALVATLRGLAPRRAAAVGLVGGMAFFLILLDWLRVLGVDAWILLSLLCAAFWAAAAAVVPWLTAGADGAAGADAVVGGSSGPGRSGGGRSGGGPSGADSLFGVATRVAPRGGRAGACWVITIPLLWTCMEAARARIPWGGFPWGRLAFAQADTPLVGWAVLGGPALVSFAVALAATSLLWAWDLLRKRRVRWGLVPLSVIGMVVIGGATLRWADLGGPDGEEQPIAIVQGNVPRLGLDFNAQRRAVLDNHVRATQELAAHVQAGRAPQPVAVIWPENSADIDPLRNPDAAAQIDRAADAIGAPILVGAVTVNPQDPRTPSDPGTLHNVALVWDPVAGPGDAYVKRHPVPFGEYLPFRDLLTRFISRFERVPRDFAPGSEPGVLTIGPVRTGIVICFEIAYDELVRDAVLAGAQVMAVQTNNATYGRTGQPEQQLAISRVQAVTTGRTTLVAATSGISAVIGPDGALLWRTEEFVSDSTVSLAATRTTRTPATRLGWAVEAFAGGLLVGCVLWRARVRRRVRVSPPGRRHG